MVRAPMTGHLVGGQGLYRILYTVPALVTIGAEIAITDIERFTVLQADCGGCPEGHITVFVRVMAREASRLAWHRDVFLIVDLDILLAPIFYESFMGMALDAIATVGIERMSVILVTGGIVPGPRRPDVIYGLRTVTIQAKALIKKGIQSRFPCSHLGRIFLIGQQQTGDKKQQTTR